MIDFKSKRVWLFISYLSLLIGNSFFSFANLSIKNLWKYDKLIHFVEYFILGFLLFNVLFEKSFTKKDLSYYILFITLVPVIDESTYLLRLLEHVVRLLLESPSTKHF